MLVENFNRMANSAMFYSYLVARSQHLPSRAFIILLRIQDDLENACRMTVCKILLSRRHRAFAHGSTSEGLSVLFFPKESTPYPLKSRLNSR